MKKLLFPSLMAVLSGCAFFWEGATVPVVIGLAGNGSRTLSVKNLNPGDTVVLSIQDAAGQVIDQQTFAHDSVQFSLMVELESGKFYTAQAYAQDMELWKRGLGQRSFLVSPGESRVDISLEDFFDSLSVGSTALPWNSTVFSYQFDVYNPSEYFYITLFNGELSAMQYRLNGGSWNVLTDNTEGFNFSVELQLGANKVEARYFQANGQAITYTFHIQYIPG